jgi:hypothetical protein
LHELIHYELPKQHGHSELFKKRARELGILGNIELEQCHEESMLKAEYVVPHTVKFEKVSLKDYALSIDKSFEELEKLIDRLPVERREKAHKLVGGAKVGWTVYRHAVEGGRDHIVNAIWKPRRGRRGKTAAELLDRLDVLRLKWQEMDRRMMADNSLLHDRKFKRERTAIDREIERLYGKLEKDYGVA